MRFTDAEWLAAFRAAGCSPARMAEATGLTERGIYDRRNRLRGLGHSIETVPLNNGYLAPKWTYPAEIAMDVRGGSVLIGSDLHAWPGEPPAIWRAFVKVAEAIRPTAIILNGDGVDGTRISRHPRLRNQNAPKITEEVDACRDWLSMLPPAQHKLWPLGNHDIRVDSYLANMAPEMDDWAGGLTDRFPDWSFCYAALINESVEVRHNFRGGIHAAWNNALHTGLNVISGHTHQLDMKSMVDRRGRRWGVEVGMLNDPNAAQFEYSLGMVRRWTPGFVLLTFDHDGLLYPPELCEWVHGKAIFRGVDVLAEKPRFRIRAVT